MTKSKISNFTNCSISSIFLILLAGCSASDEWVCKSGVNASGDAVQYSENTKTGEIGSYNKCQK